MFQPTHFHHLSQPPNLKTKILTSKILKAELKCQISSGLLAVNRDSLFILRVTFIEHSFLIKQNAHKKYFFFCQISITPSFPLMRFTSILPNTATKSCEKYVSFNLSLFNTYSHSRRYAYNQAVLIYPGKGWKVSKEEPRRFYTAFNISTAEFKLLHYPLLLFPGHGGRARSPREAPARLPGGRRSQTKPSGAAARPGRAGPAGAGGAAHTDRGARARVAAGAEAEQHCPGPGRDGLPPSHPAGGGGAGAAGAAASGRDTPALGRHAAPGAPSPTCSDWTQPGASPYYRPRLIVLLPPPFPRRHRLSPRSCQVPPFTWARDGLPLPPVPLRYGRHYANGAPPPPLPPVPTGAAQRPRRNPAPRIPPCAVRTLRIPARYERKQAIGGRSRVKGERFARRPMGWRDTATAGEPRALTCVRVLALPPAERSGCSAVAAAGASRALGRGARWGAEVLRRGRRPPSWEGGRGPGLRSLCH